MTRFLSDLDKTLLFSSVADPRSTSLEAVGGQPAAFVTAGAARLLSRLLHSKSLVPVTTRSTHQFLRLQFPGPAPSLAIVSNGGRLLVHGEVDRAFERWREARMRDSAPLDVALQVLVEAAAGHGRVRTADELFCYAVADSSAAVRAVAASARGPSHEIGWAVCVSGRKVYFTPREVTKESAAAYLVEHHIGGRVVTAGDSLLDQGLIQFGAAAMIPRHGDLAGRTWLSGTVRLTVAIGADAGEEILTWAAHQCGVVLPGEELTPHGPSGS